MPNNQDPRIVQPPKHTIVEAVGLGNGFRLFALQLGLGLVLALEIALQFGVLDFLELGAHRRQFRLQLRGAQLERVEVDRKFDVLQHLGVDAFLALVLEPHELHGQIGRQPTDEGLLKAK